MTVDAREVREILAGFVSDEVMARLSDQEPFFDQGVDSLDVVSLLLALEEKYGIVVPDEDVHLCSSVINLVTYAEGKCL